MITALKPLAAAVIAVSLLAGCKSDEEKAEDYYQSGLEYLEKGDIDRAQIEFRNVFNHDGFHREARQAYAKLRLDQGDVREAYSQYLRLVEQYPDDIEGRATLARLALSARNWDEARRHGDAAIELAPDRPDVKAIAAALTYLDGQRDRDDAKKAQAVEMAQAAVDQDGDLIAARQILIDDAVQSEDFDTALEQLDAALQTDPARLDLNMMKAQILQRQGDPEALGAHLEAMYDRFPENEQVQRALIGWYMSQQNFDAAEAFLRERAGPDDGAADGHLAVLEFLHRARGVDAAMAEADRLIAATEGSEQADLYGAARASLLFEKGDRDAAIAAAEGILQGAEATDQTRRVRVILARMLIATGNAVGARAEIEKVLETDPTNVDALKIRAAWLIQGDQPDEAIFDLRTALDQSPRDPEILTMMAEAHQRNGSPQLAQERLALAMEVSGNRAEESLRYARFVMQQGRPALAETVLDNARKVTPGNTEILGMLSEIYLRDSRWDEARGVAQQLNEIGTEQATKMANTIESALLVGQEKVEDGLRKMQDSIADPGGSDMGALLRVLRTQVATGRIEEARGYLEEVKADNPDNLALKLFDANLTALEGDQTGAEAIYREILQENPRVEPAVLQLAGLLASSGREDESQALIDQGLQDIPNSRQLVLIKAGRLEREGQIDEAIALYEELYQRNSSDVVVANNLASLLSAWRADDPQALDRAEVISRRLRGTNVAAFQDTLGWILYLKQDYSGAVEALEAAAEGLPGDPNVALHLGLAYAALNQDEAAKAELQRGLDMAGDRDLSQSARAREVLEGL